MPRRIIAVGGERWAVSPAGRITQYDKDEFARLKGKFVQDLRDSGEVIAYGKNGEPAVSPPGVAEPRTPSDV